MLINQTKKLEICGSIYFWLSSVSFISIGNEAILKKKKQNYEKGSRQEGPHHNGFMPTVISQDMQKHGATLQSAHGWGLIICRLVEGGGCLSPPVASSRQNIPCIRSRELKAAGEFSSLPHTCMHHCLRLRKIGFIKQSTNQNLSALELS